MASIKLRHQRFWAKVRVPKTARHHHDGREFLERNLLTSDRKKAEVEAAAWEAMLRLEWQEKSGALDDEPSAIRQLYSDLRRRATAGEFTVEALDVDPQQAGIEHELDKVADTVGERDMGVAEAARVAALQDALLELQGQKVPRRKELEPTFSEVVDAFMAQWRTQRSLKETNTEQQKEATFRLFQSFWNNRPIRTVTEADASSFHDALRRTDPKWARSPQAKDMSWSEIQKEFGGRPKGLADATMNRHMAALKALWDWSSRRGHCSGHNPFDGFHRKLQPGRNVSGYVAWETDELNTLFRKPPKRQDLREVILVGMFSGMRLDEIASLQWDQIRTAEGVTYVQVIDAKTPAGNRQVPLHPSAPIVDIGSVSRATPKQTIRASDAPSTRGKLTRVGC